MIVFLFQNFGSLKICLIARQCKSRKGKNKEACVGRARHSFAAVAIQKDVEEKRVPDSRFSSSSLESCKPFSINVHCKLGLLIHIFLKIADEIYNITGREYSGKSCQEKWKNMKQQYRQRQDEENRSGAGPLSDWIFHKPMEEICGNNPEVTLRHVHEAGINGIVDKRNFREVT